MKRLIILFFIVVVAISCIKTPQQKADNLIKDYMKRFLFHPDTYNPSYTVMDSAFAPYDSPEFFNCMDEIIELSDKYEQVSIKMKLAKSDMSIWQPDGYYHTAFARNQYQEAKEKYDKYSDELEKLEKEKMSIIAKGKQIIENANKSKDKFIGFKVTHSYRADNNAGLTIGGSMIFIIDKNISKILYAVEDDEYEDYQTLIKELKLQIKTNN